MERKVTLNKTQHSIQIMNSLKRMTEDGDLCDFTIKVGEMILRAHKNILSAGSEYFEAMFKHDTLESRNGEVEMKDMDPECFKSCFNFIYTAEFDIPEEKTLELLHVSHILQLDDVTKSTVRFLEKNLTVDNFFSTKQIAKLFKVKSLLKECENFEKNNIVELSRHPEFKSEDAIRISRILQSPKIVMSHEEKLQVLLNWVGENMDKKEDFIHLLALIDLNQVPIDYLKDVIDQNSLLMNDSYLSKAFDDAVRFIIDQEQRKYENDQMEKKLLLFNRDEDCLHTFDPETNEVEDYSEAKFLHLGSFAAIYMNSYIYVLSLNRSVHRLDSKIKNSDWEKMPDMIAGHGWYPPAVVSHGCLFVIGSDLTMFRLPSNFAERFDPSTNRWVKVTDKPRPIGSHALVSMDGFIYCIGGRTRRTESKSVSRFDPASLEWSDLPPMRNIRMHSRAVAISPTILVFGGWRGGQKISEIESFNVMTSQWSVISTGFMRYFNIRVCQIHHTIFIGGFRETSNSMVKYDAEDNEWKRVDGIPAFEMYDFICISTGK